MDKRKTPELREVIVLLTNALALADHADELLLGAKIDEALECARDAISPSG